MGKLDDLYVGRVNRYRESVGINLCRFFSQNYGDSIVNLPKEI